MSDIIFILTVALLFGGMVLYSFGFAAFVFSALPADVAGPLLRKAFPHFYAFVAVTALVAAGLAGPDNELAASLMLMIALTTVLTRQLLMPAINRATDTQARARFKVLHSFSVLMTLSHIAAAGFVLTQWV
ncbi:DUF4149 domain-containing protein [Limnohabitans sp.]|uniref:DUF4149 domain-containing protein n=1 Tax=Limnohabitans sp. TaxID=1907725 RepID=UPI0025B910FB|nr:DUF4149 domain-containing protein [Limnohabitans sp.]